MKRMREKEREKRENITKGGKSGMWKTEMKKGRKYKNCTFKKLIVRKWRREEVNVSGGQN